MIKFAILFINVLLLITPSMAQEKNDRAQIMDVLRLDFYPNTTKASKNEDAIKFIVRYYKEKNGWACVNVEPTKNGKPYAEPRWAILQKTSGTWINRNYADAVNMRDDIDALDVLSFEADTSKRVQKAFPNIPKEILP